MTESQAMAIKQRHSLALLKTPGVQGVGLQRDPGGNQTLVIIADPMAQLTELPSEIEGLPVLLEASGPFKP